MFIVSILAVNVNIILRLMFDLFDKNVMRVTVIVLNDNSIIINSNLTF